MTDNTFNHNAVPKETGSLREPDSYGQAAMLLVESLIHGLVARSVISLDDAIEVVDVATEVKREIGEDLGDSPANLRASLLLLNRISDSLRVDQRR